MILLLDCDGPAADFSNTILRLVGSKKRLRDVKSWDIFSLMTQSEKQRALRFLGNDTGWFWSEQPVVRGAKAGVKALREAGHQIHWVTSPWISCRTWEAARRDWLNQHFGASHKDVTVTFAKHLVHGDAFIDDKPSNVASWLSHVKGETKPRPGTGLLYDAPYNQDLSDIKEEYGDIHLPRVTWKTIPEIVSKLAHDQTVSRLAQKDGSRWQT